MNLITRREYIKCCCAAASGILMPGYVFASGSSQGNDSEYTLVEARYYEKLENRKIKCQLCPRECIIDDLERGYCGVRENRNGVYYTLVYARPCIANIDPVEKKPLFHFLPGSLAFSIATAGCNVMCKFCQNWEISQARPEQIDSYNMPPARIAATAKQNSCLSIAYTYSEPTIFTEYMYDTALAGREKGIKSVMISNGFIQKKPMQDLCTVLHAVKIDLKAFTEKFYTELVAGHLQPVLDTLVLLRENNIWTEIVYLVIPGKNDDPVEINNMCKWIFKEMGPDVPIHFTRFHPQYRLTNLPPTPLKTLQKCRQIALDNGLHFVYTGNIPGDEGENTFCPNCKKMIIKRIGFSVSDINIKKGKCSYCHTVIPGVWS